MSEVYGLIHNHMLGEESNTIEQSKYQDYIGFIFNGKHSSEFGIVRTSDGSRFNENLLPTIQDKTVQVPGGDGTYFFGSYYTQRQFTVPFAFDSMTEKQFNNLKNWLGDKKPHDLIFDEAPYKVYKAKITGSATIKYIPFGEGETNRLYKGEGSIQFTCYQPYARSRFKKIIEIYKKDEKGNFVVDENENMILDHYEIPSDSLTEKYGNYFNINEWKSASGILTAYKYDNKDLIKGSSSYSIINLYNPGCIDSHFKLKIISTEGTIAAGSIAIDNNKLSWKEFKLKGKDTYVVINTKINLIEGYNDENNKTGEIYNEYIESGTFFKIPTGTDDSFQMELIGVPLQYDASTKKSIEYDYYYL